MELTRFFTEHPKAAIAFSGGVDSAYLLYAAIRAGADVTAYCACTEFQPRLLHGCGMTLKIVSELMPKEFYQHKDIIMPKEYEDGGE